MANSINCNKGRLILRLNNPLPILSKTDARIFCRKLHSKHLTTYLNKNDKAVNTGH